MKSVRDIDVSGKTLFIRVDYNLPMDDHGNITDDNRIRATLDLISYLIEKKAKLVLASHLGRPKGGREEKFSLKPAALRLSELLKMPVEFADDCIGDAVKQKVQALEPGQILMLENLRFHEEEKKNDPGFAKALADLCDVYVNNAFAVSHRDQASVTGITMYAKSSVAGFLLEKEVRSYCDSVEHPKKPLTVVIGGAKVSSKLAALENMLKFVDCMIIGGAMANTFLAANGVDTKGSMIEPDLIPTASNIMAQAREKGIELLLPVDLVVAEQFAKNAQSRIVSLDEIPDGWMALDIGPESANGFAKAIADAGTIVWNGPMGVFEMERFAAGTQIVADAIAASAAFSVVGGGDTGLAAKQCGITEKVSYISTGGGAFLHMMEGKVLPGVAALE
ncbi:phosphoglycerate kinase [uncultured Desulfobacter sp.]|uniref:phosphoglycerate kinase n=1 Tax=uncultured Desulfobacter sp. TaxID=240139 RepID=UPI0029F500E6|nr:phosphoglycerate kinase [uncultured Desulfobacter sp.]